MYHDLNNIVYTHRLVDPPWFDAPDVIVETSEVSITVDWQQMAYDLKIQIDKLVNKSKKYHDNWERLYRNSKCNPKSGIILTISEYETTLEEYWTLRNKYSRQADDLRKLYNEYRERAEYGGRTLSEIEANKQALDIEQRTFRQPNQEVCEPVLLDCAASWYQEFLRQDNKVVAICRCGVSSDLVWFNLYVAIAGPGCIRYEAAQVWNSHFVRVLTSCREKIGELSYYDDRSIRPLYSYKYYNLPPYTHQVICVATKPEWADRELEWLVECLQLNKFEVLYRQITIEQLEDRYFNPFAEDLDTCNKPPIVTSKKEVNVVGWFFLISFIIAAIAILVFAVLLT